MNYKFVSASLRKASFDIAALLLKYFLQIWDALRWSLTESKLEDFGVLQHLQQHLWSFSTDWMVQLEEEERNCVYVGLKSCSLQKWSKCQHLSWVIRNFIDIDWHLGVHIMGSTIKTTSSFLLFAQLVLICMNSVIVPLDSWADTLKHNVSTNKLL